MSNWVSLILLLVHRQENYDYKVQKLYKVDGSQWRHNGVITLASRQCGVNSLRLQQFLHLYTLPVSAYFSCTNSIPDVVFMY